MNNLNTLECTVQSLLREKVLMLCELKLTGNSNSLQMDFNWKMNGQFLMYRFKFLYNWSELNEIEHDARSQSVEQIEPTSIQSSVEISLHGNSQNQTASENSFVRSSFRQNQPSKLIKLHMVVCDKDSAAREILEPVAELIREKLETSFRIAPQYSQETNSSMQINFDESQSLVS